MRLNIFLGIILVAFFIFLITQPHGPMPQVLAGSTPRLVLLYATCTVNKSYLAPYTRGVEYTPNLKNFGDRSIVFTRHQTESPFSGAAYAALFSGTYLYRHGVYYHPHKLADSSYLIAEAFRDNGYETFFWNKHDLASAALNYAQGVQSKNVFSRTPKDGKTLNALDPKFTSILNHLRKDSNYRAFIQVNFSMTHTPYSDNSGVDQTLKFCSLYPSECEHLTREDLAQYTDLFKKNHAILQFHFSDAVKSLNLSSDQISKLTRVQEVTYKSSVHMLDLRFGQTLDALRKSGLMKTAIVIFTADHGEVLYRKGSSVEWMHGRLEPEIMNIPLMINIAAGSIHKTYDRVTRSIDIFPTLVSLCRLKIPVNTRIDGQDLSTAMISGKAPDLLAYSFNEMHHPAVAKDDVRTVNLLVRARDTIYRMYPSENGRSSFAISDAQNYSSLPVDSKNKTTIEMERDLQSYRDRVVRAYVEPEDENEEYKQIRESLKSLGYLH